VASLISDITLRVVFGTTQVNSKELCHDSFDMKICSRVQPLQGLRTPRAVPDKFTTYTHTYHSRFIPEEVAEVSQIFLRDTHVSPKLVSCEEHCRRDR
jgi:hypothetical protein